MTDSPPFSLEDARLLATEAHAGQTDKLGRPYSEHVEAVADGLVDFDLDIQIAGMLHDIVEDTGVTIDDLRGLGVSERSLAAIELVSRNLHEGLSYDEGIKLVTTQADATLVKISDNAHNSRPDRVKELSDITGEPPDPKYARAREILYARARDADIQKIKERIRQTAERTTGGPNQPYDATMAYDKQLAERIRELINGEHLTTEQRMFGGLGFMIGGNMAVAASSGGGILVRVDPDDSDVLVESTPAELMEMGGRSMRGWLHVAGEHLGTDADLAPWVQRGASYAAGLPAKKT